MTEPSSETTTRFTSVESTKCRRCAEILRTVLSKPGSRPVALLEAISGGLSDGRNAVSSRENGILARLNGNESIDQPDDVSSAAGIIEKESGSAGISSLVRRWTQNRSESSSQGSTVMETLTKPIAASLATEKASVESLAIQCRPCGLDGAEGGARAFVMGPKPLSIVLCSNRLHELGGSSVNDAAEEMEEVLVHELMHVYDIRRLRLNLQDCQQLAYSEVRAAREAECKRISWAVPQSYCVRQKAQTATLNMFPRDGRRCVEHVLQRALADRRPFGPNADGNHGEDLNGKATTAQSDLKKKTTGQRQHFMPYPSER